MTVFSEFAVSFIHVSDDGWMTRCGQRASRPASASDVKKYGKCTRCAS